MKEKIAFVVIRYGREINGGAEQHCRMLAERVADDYDVEVLTTCVKDYRRGGNSYAPGTGTLNGVTVRRFSVDFPDPHQECSHSRKAKKNRRIRHLLFKAGILPLIARFHPIWKSGCKEDIEALKHSIFYSSDMMSYIRSNKDSYKCFIVFTVDYAPFYFTAMEAGEKTIAIPTLHNAKVSFRPSLTEAFSRIRFVGFNTPAEQRLGKRIFGKALGTSGIIGCSIDGTGSADWEMLRKKYGIPDRYIMYLGRIDRSKTGKLSSFYQTYRMKAGDSALPLLMTGGIMDTPDNTEGMIFTGFVDNRETKAILEHAALLINPSYYESLSLVVLEALDAGTPVLVNGRCDVLKEHCRRSGGAVQYYMSGRDFARKAIMITGSAGIAADMAAKGKRYFTENYSWGPVLERLRNTISSF